ncbi:Uncharacterised protein [Mycobacteroides abscessus subsp. abscessus]|nr:Uncharacterised protein [Mycobacteroides abscessus subsp. abscessus]
MSQLVTAPELCHDNFVHFPTYLPAVVNVIAWPVPAVAGEGRGVRPTRRVHANVSER